MRSNFSNRNKSLVKPFILLMVFLSGYTTILAQENITRIDAKPIDQFSPQNDFSIDIFKDLNQIKKANFQPKKELIESDSATENEIKIIELETQLRKSNHSFYLKEELNKSEELKIKEFPTEFSDEPKLPETFETAEKFHWKPAIVESLYFLGIQHGFRMVQKKTRRELNGEFFSDWGKSVRNLKGWRDGDSFMTNYIAHPMQGAVTGRIFINNSDKSKKLEFGKSKEYWESRFKTMAWSAVWSTQFELGPISEGSIGNVGLYDDVGPNLMGWVDLVITPTAGTAAIIGEDLIDKYVLKKWLEKGSSRTRIKLFRTFFTPFQSFTNVLRWKAPWKRDNR